MVTGATVRLEMTVIMACSHTITTINQYCYDNISCNSIKQ